MQVIGHDDHYWNAAFTWLCRRRLKSPPNADIWHLWWKWSEQREVIYRRVISGEYRLSPMLVCGRKESELAMWSATDALVLKWVSLHIRHQLPSRDNCMHLQGARKCVRRVAEALNLHRYRSVYRTDIRGYYRHIRKENVVRQIDNFVTDPVQRDLVKQYVN